tara:strand:- start:5554 stop:6468 length:915 start_codon:yes stop_codon:yes gene_type:complete
MKKVAILISGIFNRAKEFHKKQAEILLYNFKNYDVDIFISTQYYIPKFSECSTYDTKYSNKYYECKEDLIVFLNKIYKNKIRKLVFVEKEIVYLNEIYEKIINHASSWIQNYQKKNVLNTLFFYKAINNIEYDYYAYCRPDSLLFIHSLKNELGANINGFYKDSIITVTPDFSYPEYNVNKYYSKMKTPDKFGRINEYYSTVHRVKKISNMNFNDKKDIQAINIEDLNIQKDEIVIPSELSDIYRNEKFLICNNIKCITVFCSWIENILTDYNAAISPEKNHYDYVEKFINVRKMENWSSHYVI